MSKMKLFAGALLASTLLASPALAQSDSMAPRAPAAAPQTLPAKPMTDAAAMQHTGQWRTSKFVGLDVYNASNEKIGDIKELISGKDGKIDTVVIGVGGFLGMGEHNVGLKWNDVKFINEPVRSTSTTNTTNGASRTTGSATTVPATVPAAPVSASTTVRDYPDHAMVNMSKDQLKAMTAFKYASDTKSR